MEAFSPRKLLDSLLRLDFVSSNSALKCGLAQRYCQNLDEMLSIVKTLLEYVCESEFPPDEELNKYFRELDAVTSVAWELTESWHHSRSKIYFVMQMDSTVSSIQTCILHMCKCINSLMPSSMACTSSCIEKLQSTHTEDISTITEKAVKDFTANNILDQNTLNMVSASLCLSTNLELYMEVVALENLRTVFYSRESRSVSDRIESIVPLINYMHENIVKEKQVNSINGVSISTDFCCPLSLELMSDPVIVASGQTYERVFIKLWLDEGFSVCPKTRQKLSHTNLIPNYTVKALIANWCELHAITLPDPVKSLKSIFPFNAFVASDSGAATGSPLHSGHSPRGAFLGSQESNSYMKNLQKESILHEPHQRSPVHGNVIRPYGQASTVHSSQVLNSEVEVSRHSLSASGGKEGSTSGNNIVSDAQTSYTHVDRQYDKSVSGNGVPQTNGYSQESHDDPGPLASDGLRYESSDALEAKQNGQVSVPPTKGPEYLPRLSDVRTRSQLIWRQPSDRAAPKIVSTSLDSRPDHSAIESQVRDLVEQLSSESVDVQRAATAELRLLAKNTTENRIIIANCGAISLLVGLLYSPDLKIQENAVTTLLNLSINDNNKISIGNANAIDPLIHVLESGNVEAKENAAATLFSLSVMEDNKVKIGRSGAIKPLVELLGHGTPQGKKDASTALFNLSILNENKARIVQAGAVKHLVELMDPAVGMVDKAVAVLANLATIHDGRTAIGSAGGIPGLVEVVELGSARGKENAAAALLLLCINSSRYCSIVLQEGAVPPLVILSQTGTPRAKEKAQTLLTCFRNQRHGNSGRR